MDWSPQSMLQKVNDPKEVLETRHAQQQMPLKLVKDGKREPITVQQA